MDKKIILIGLYFLYYCCTPTVDKIDVVQKFYRDYAGYDFDKFGCMNIIHWNPRRQNQSQEYYHVELYPECNALNKPLRGTLKFEGQSPIFVSTHIENIETDLFLDFKKFNITSLYCAGRDSVVISIYPDIWLIKSCHEVEGYVSIDSCWKYKIRTVE